MYDSAWEGSLDQHLHFAKLNSLSLHQFYRYFTRKFYNFLLCVQMKEIRE